MHILLTAATGFEIQPTIHFLQQQPSVGRNHRFNLLISGIGSISTTYSLTDYIHQHRPDYILQAGIGGSFSENHPPTSLVFVNEEVVGDMGAAEKDDFKDLFDLGLLRPDSGIYTNRSLVNPHTSIWEGFHIPFVKGITINEISTQPSRIGLLQQKYKPVVESMEGAALHYVCLMKNIPFMQLRAVSNKVGERDKTRWKMKEAIALLNEKLVHLIQNFPG